MGDKPKREYLLPRIELDIDEDVRHETMDQFLNPFFEKHLSRARWGKLISALVVLGNSEQHCKMICAWHYGYRPKHEEVFKRCNTIYDAAVNNNVLKDIASKTIEQWDREVAEATELKVAMREKQKNQVAHNKEPTQKMWDDLVKRGKGSTLGYRENVIWAADHSPLSTRDAVKQAPNNQAYQLYTVANKNPTQFWGTLYPKAVNQDDDGDDDIIVKKDKRDIKDILAIIAAGVDATS